MPTFRKQSTQRKNVFQRNVEKSVVTQYMQSMKVHTFELPAAFHALKFEIFREQAGVSRILLHPRVYS